jgi:peptidoglycan/LPS O-acetylase OafA/YrhL
MYKQISYFKSLNSLRFFAALLVLFHHSETMRAKYTLFNLNNISLFCNGHNAVLFFFVLSGFLITYLLLKEDNKNKTISVKMFYFKRILRIWPLYFLLIIMGTICLPLIINRFTPPYTNFRTRLINLGSISFSSFRV